jgi:DNA-binding PadR family transcriptional regulator
MDEQTLNVLGQFKRFNKESLDLHELFEAGGNDPDGRKEVLYTIEQLVEEGFLEERGNDFYALTEQGRRVAESIQLGPEPEEGEVGYF